MANLTQGHYHCIECGTLFEAEILDASDQRCSVCGNPPTGKILAGTLADKEGSSGSASGVDQADAPSEKSGITQDTREIYEATLEAQSKRARGRVKRTKRRQKRSKKILVMLLVWVALMALTIGLVNYFDPEEEDDPKNNPEIIAARQARQQEAERKISQAVIQKAAPSCAKVITEFLNAPSAASKAQFVYQGATLATEMDRYYQRNPSFSSTRSQVKLARAELLKGTPKQTIASICINQHGEVFEAVFVRVGENWKLDWKSVVRFDTRSWSVFPSGDDGDVGEFRLYMRIRDSNKKFNSGNINLVFYKPNIYLKGEYRPIPSPSVSVAFDSEVGQKILKLVENEEDMQQDAYGFNMGAIDPLGYHRVRVKMKLHKDGLEHSFELLEILDTHWYGANVVETKEEETEEDSTELESGE